MKNFLALSLVFFALSVCNGQELYIDSVATHVDGQLSGFVKLHYNDKKRLHTVSETYYEDDALITDLVELFQDESLFTDSMIFATVYPSGGRTETFKTVYLKQPDSKIAYKIYQNDDEEIVLSTEGLMTLNDAGLVVETNYRYLDDLDQNLQRLKLMYNEQGQIDSVYGVQIDESTMAVEELYAAKFIYENGNRKESRKYYYGFLFEVVTYEGYVGEFPSVTKFFGLDFFTQELNLNSIDSLTFNPDGSISEYFYTDFYFEETTLEKYTYETGSFSVYSYPELNSALNMLSIASGYQSEIKPFTGFLNSKNKLEKIEYFTDQGNGFLLDKIEYVYYLDVLSPAKEVSSNLSQLLLYPNPSSDLLFIDGNVGYERWYIVNGKGQVMMNGSSHQNGIDISKLEAGTYHLIFKSADLKDAAVSSFLKI